ncbi:hypothetical protein [Myxacorys almedinensis]|uniref:Uncharacterized protein n=1 Tax=Myxacorys almedinensis A TaxID=2690445 RepID=A0A8J7Z689_9CYAN|nr:hypothetical protein [Myxacorys almedinensis]NDJ18671.1 hypothetical protein [Myxacorys almedinensis A]
MKLLNLKQIMVFLGASGASALMGLPVLAQTSPGSPLNPAPPAVNQAPINQTPDRCADYIQGGVGGPATSSSVNQFPTQSNIGGTGRQATDQSQIGSASYSATGEYRQFSGTNPSAAVAYRANGPAGTSGREAIMNLEANLRRDRANLSTTNPNVSGVNPAIGSIRSTTRDDYRQFSGTNPSAAVAYRANGPAGTSGREAILNLEANLQRDRNLSLMNTSSLTAVPSNQAAAPIPTECLPR